MQCPEQSGSIPFAFSAKDRFDSLVVQIRQPAPVQSDIKKDFAGGADVSETGRATARARLRLAHRVRPALFGSQRRADRGGVIVAAQAVEAEWAPVNSAGAT